MLASALLNIVGTKKIAPTPYLWRNSAMYLAPVILDKRHLLFDVLKDIYGHRFFHAE
jgi:hypothetical protein